MSKPTACAEAGIEAAFTLKAKGSAKNEIDDFMMGVED